MLINGYTYDENLVIEIGDYRFDLNFPLWWQTKELEAEILCAECDLSNNCRECEYYEFSLLYVLEGKDG